jgi:hypothetical protein
MVDEIKAKLTVPGLIKGTVSVPDQLAGKVTGEVMLDPDVNLIKVNGVAVSKTNPVPVEMSDGTNFVSPAKESDGNLEEIKTQADKLQFDASGNLKTTVTGAVDADVTGTVSVTNIDAKLSDIKTKTDNLDAKLSDIKNKTDNLDAKLSDIKSDLDKIPSSPSQEHTAPDSASSVRVSADGTHFLADSYPMPVALKDLDLLMRLVLANFHRINFDSMDDLYVNVAGPTAGRGTWYSSSSSSQSVTAGSQTGIIVHARSFGEIDAKWALKMLYEANYIAGARSRLTFS